MKLYYSTSPVVIVCLSPSGDCSTVLCDFQYATHPYILLHAPYFRCVCVCVCNGSTYYNAAAAAAAAAAVSSDTIRVVSSLPVAVRQ